MAQLIEAKTISAAWLAALESLLAGDGKAVNLSVAIASPREEPAVRAAFDGFLRSQRAAGTNVYGIRTVANTLFPAALYQPSREGARERLYQLHAEAQTVHGRRAQSETYFDRLVNWPGPEGPVNQLDLLVERVKGQLAARAPKSSAYEAGVWHPADGEAPIAPETDGEPHANGDLRIQSPGRDKRYIGFPCLSHISLTLTHGTLVLSALYRNQHFIDRAYGNYVGLARIGEFLAHEVGCELGEIVCLATHADAQIGKYRRDALGDLVATCREAVTSPAAPVGHANA